MSYNGQNRGVMEGQERRKELLSLLKHTKTPLSGSQLAKSLGVSRQVIVQDIALLRAVNKNILSTTKGYLLYLPQQQKIKHCFRVCHTTAQIEDELMSIVNLGGTVLDVIVEHPIYGVITVDLMISTCDEAKDFSKKVIAGQTVPLKELTKDIHLHTVEADTEEILIQIETLLRQKGYLYPPEKENDKT